MTMREPTRDRRVNVQEVVRTANLRFAPVGDPRRRVSNVGRAGRCGATGEAARAGAVRLGDAAPRPVHQLTEGLVATRRSGIRSTLDGPVDRAPPRLIAR